MAEQPNPTASLEPAQSETAIAPAPASEAALPAPLKFKVAPHLVQDLGLNLYTTLPKVLVEFVANAYDADSPDVSIEMDFDLIKKERDKLRAEYEYELAKSTNPIATSAAVPSAVLASPAPPAPVSKVVPLGQRLLPPEVTIRIVDNGCGMSREDLQTRFLITGRRRREEEKTSVSPIKKRPFMGRKGVGKLAGFGVAQSVTITSRKAGESHATRIILDYRDIGKQRTTDDVVIPEETLVDGGGLPATGGTSILLSGLLHEPLQSRKDTISRQLAEHFWLVGKNDFEIKLAGEVVPPPTPEFVYAWPTPSLAPATLVDKELTTEDKQVIKFRYRVRFRKNSLNTNERGFRIYAHGRLAALPNLLDAPSGMHGFRQTDYLDGVVEADFIDDQPMDYIATDRQSLRWDTPLLKPLRQFLNEQIKEACKEHQKERDAESEKKAEEDVYTKKLIQDAGMPKHRAKAIHKMAAALATVCSEGIEGTEYKQRIKILVDGVSQGDILTALRDLARANLPNLNQVVDEISELTARELGDFSRYISGRLAGIDALDKIVKHQDFKRNKNETELHDLLEKNAWLIDPTFTQFLTSDRSESTVFAKLEQDLGVGKSSSTATGSSERPDLVFLLHNEGLKRLVIVELKAPNVPLSNPHLLQLRGYVRRARTWLESKGHSGFTVEGILIGCHADPSSKAEDVELLREELERSGNRGVERVFDLVVLLTMTRRAHEELLGIYKKYNAS